MYADGVEKENGHTVVYHADGRAAYYVPDPNLNPQPAPECVDWRYEWAMRDHLGNTRLTLADLDCDGYIHAVDGDWSAQPVGLGYTEILQENHYYAFGMTMEGPWRQPFAPGVVNV